MSPTSYGGGAYGSGTYAGTDYQSELAAFSSFPLILVEIQFPDETIYLSGQTVRFNEKLYEGKNLNIGAFRRALQQNLGIFEVSSIEVQIADTDRFMIQQDALTNVRGSVVTFKLGTDKLPLASYQVFHQGKIDDYGANNFTFRVLVRDRLWTLPPLPDSGRVTASIFPNALPAHVGKPIPFCYGTHSDTGTDDAKNRGSWPTLFVDVTSSARTFLIAGHAVKSIDQVYAYKPTAGSQLLTETTDYVAYKNGTLNGQTMAFINLTSAGFAKLVDTNALGQLTVNVTGKETLGDGTGDLLTNPVDVLQDMLSNYLLSPPFNSDKFAEAKSVAGIRGYVVSGGYVTDQDTQTLLRDFCNSFNIRIYPDTQGRIAVDIYEPAGPSDTVQAVGDMWEILSKSWVIDFVSGIQGAEDAQIVNWIDFEYGYHYARAFYASSNSTTDTTSISSYGTKKLKVSMPWTDSITTAQDVAYRIITLYRNPVPHASFKVPLLGMLIDLTDQISVSHDDAALVGPYNDEPFEVLEHTFNPAEMNVTMRARNVSTISSGGYFLDDESARARVSDGTIAVTNGSVSIVGTGNSSFILAGVVVGDILSIVNPTNEANRLNLKITNVPSGNSIETSQSVWTSESGLSYTIIPSWITASPDQKLRGHLCDETTGEFSNGDEGFVTI